MIYPKYIYRRDEDAGKKVPIETHMDRFRSLNYWIEDAMDKKQ